MTTEEGSLDVRTKWRGVLQHLGSAIGVVLLLIAGYWGGHLLTPHEESEALSAGSAESAIPDVIELPPTKVESAHLELAEVTLMDMQASKTVAATIDYDANRHLSIKAPVACVIERWLVKPGQQVEPGTPLVVLSGAEIALARTEIKKCQADEHIAQMNLDWQTETQKNLQELLAALRARPTVESVESKFDGKRLGEHRDHLLSTYTQYVLASNVAERSKPLGVQGVIASSTAEARSMQRDVAANAFQSACEQSEFEGTQKLAMAQAELTLAEQNLAVAEDRLRLLLGPLAEDSTSPEAPGDFEIHAPFAGRVEKLYTSPASRLAQSEPILALADTSRLWVSALIHQHDWDALQVGGNEVLHVEVPAIPEDTFTAKVSFVGAEVSPLTRAVPLVAEIDNRQGRFRPGMFAWVELPLEPLRRGLAVPTAAVQRHETEVFVFVVEAENRFRRAAIKTGLETTDFVEVREGLAAGQTVVAEGAFFLKSELLLEQEEE